MRKFGLMVTVFLFSAGVATAATVELKDGRVVQGDILKQDAKNLQINVDGVTMTYYADEIKDIDGKAIAPAESNASTSTGNMDPEKKALILQFIDVFGTRQALNNNFEMMLDQIAKSKPEEAQNIRQKVKIDEIIERLLPVYDRNFTSDDLKAFITFYSSPEGKKLIATIPTLMKESVQESIKYMQDKFPEVKSGQ